MSDIPYDVWQYIASFLSSDDTKSLLTVNYALFNIAMDERYRSSMFGSLFHPNTMRTLSRLVDPQVGSRVRLFRFMPGHLCQLLQERESMELHKPMPLYPELESSDLGEGSSSNPTPRMPLETRLSTLGNAENRKRVPRQYLRKSTYSMQRFDANARTGMPTNFRLGTPIKAPPISADVALERLSTLMGNMLSLITLEVEIRGEEHYYVANSKASIFDFGWSTFGSSLRNLELRIPLEDMAKVLPDPDKVILTCLDSLYLRIIRASFSTAEEPIILETMLPFLTAHRHTLRSLTLDIAEQTDLSFLLLAVILSSLTHFKLKAPLANQDDRRFTVLQSFFKSHRAHLTHFEIELVPTFIHPFALPTFFAQDHFTSYLPRLQHLSIHTPSHNRSMLAYIQQFRSTLVSLHVHKTHRWSLEEIRLLVESFLASGRLRNLNIAVFEFSPELLVTLAINLPNLNVLTLDIDAVMPQGEVYNSSKRREVPQFCDVMEGLFFPQWQLRTLNTTPLHVVHSLRASYKDAVTKSLPNVSSFSGLGRKEYIDTPAFI